jgi:hypothetical protein
LMISLHCCTYFLPDGFIICFRVNWFYFHVFLQGTS